MVPFWYLLRNNFRRLYIMKNNIKNLSDLTCEDIEAMFDNDELDEKLQELIDQDSQETGAASKAIDEILMELSDNSNETY